MEKTKEFIKEYGFDLGKVILSGILIGLSFLIGISEWVKIVLCVAAALISGFELILEIPENLKERRFFDETALMLIAAAVAFFLGEWVEGAAVLTLFALGEFLEDAATDDSHKKIAGLSGLKSDTARLITGDTVSEVAPDSVEIGSIIEVRKGDRVAIDGILEDESGEFDFKAITGESKIYELKKGDKVYGGGINLGNAVKIKTTEKYVDSTVEKIIAMVENSAEKKARSQKFITKFAAVYTPCVILFALLVAILPPFIDGYDFPKWIMKALNFMVVACPCALVISVPLSYFIGIGSLSRLGILVKGAAHLETLSETENFAFDKTGTLTEGVFKVESHLLTGEESIEEVATAVYQLERTSAHPIAIAVMEYCEKYADKSVKLYSPREIAGKGVTGEINGATYAVGNAKLLNSVNADAIKSGDIYVAKNGKLVCTFSIKDGIKKDAAVAVAALKNYGAKNMYIISGDEESAVLSVAEKAGIENFYSSLLPEEKLKTAEEIMEKNGKLAYVGDGVNDAPVLSRADLGIAMGALGSQAAIDCADAVIMDDDVKKVAILYSHSKKVRRIVKENVIFSLAVKFSVMVLSVAVSVPLFLATIADVGVMLLCVANALRNYGVKKINGKTR